MQQQHDMHGYGSQLQVEESDPAVRHCQYINQYSGDRSPWMDGYMHAWPTGKGNWIPRNPAMEVGNKQARPLEITRGFGSQGLRSQQPCCSSIDPSVNLQTWGRQAYADHRHRSLATLPYMDILHISALINQRLSTRANCASD